MEVAKITPLSSVFIEEPHYAWELLESELEVEMSPSVDGKVVARLISLYMRGVERLNSLQDTREAFFRQRLTSLMMKPNVVRILATPVKAAKNTLQTEGTQRQSPGKDQQSKISASYHQKRKQMQMQIQYHSSDTQGLNKMLAQHNTKTATVQTKISQAIESSKSKIEQRIKQKKARAQIARSMSEKHNQNSASGKKQQTILLNPISEQPRSRRVSKYSGVKRRLSLTLEVLPALEQQFPDLKPKRKYTDTMKDLF